MKDFVTLEDIAAMDVIKNGRFFSATGAEIEQGLTSDIYFVRTRDLLAKMGLADKVVTAEIFSSRDGVLAGVDEALYLLRNKNLEIWTLTEGEVMDASEVVMRIKGKYRDFGVYETPLLGILASSSGWATAARSCKVAAAGRTVICYGARHVHPAVAPVMERAAVVGGVDGCSCVLGALLLGRIPMGTIPHAAFLIVGDTVKLALAYDRFVSKGDPRIVLVDTFKDEPEEALRVAEALGKQLTGIRLDTPGERGGVTAGLVRETRARLNQAGFQHVQIVVSGGLDLQRIAALAEAGADAFGVGSFISHAAAIDMTMDLKEVQGEALAKRGRIPGITENKRLVKVT
ncbi:MAG TPA: nicotinate phosphoribosyltransferase [Candidatus Limnocylindrales bacterium]|nr:nicotinate phosphoribosyltransferase [Candidatus Limnocylindrales bacterium]